tara:strand:- start:807 stop:1469 length:663 start_codon:yes stop_codon:yes gene_type:complete
MNDTKPTLPAQLATELLGTFFLLLSISMVSSHLTASTAHIAPLPIGLVLMTLVYIGGPISGAHYNPVVTIGLTLTGHSPWRKALPYMLVQFGGALLAAIVAIGIQTDAEQVAKSVATEGFIVESLWTFLLMYVILQVVSPTNRGKPWDGLAIGMTVATGAWAVGPISGAIFNPAVWAGLSFTGELSWNNWFLYIIAPLVGVLAAVLFNWITSMTITDRDE